MIEKNCQKCGGVFYHAEGEEWKRLCVPCFKEKKRDEEREIEWRRDRQPQTERVVYRDRVVDRVVYKEKEIPPEMLDRMIRLCHPDKHGNSPSSNAVTAWLLAQRK